jgi:hypothetical protein
LEDEKLNTRTAPAAEAVTYETIRYNLKPIMTDSPYVGWGPEVDKLWEAITGDSTCRAPIKPGLITKLTDIVVGDQMITPEQAAKMGFDPDSLKITHPKTGVEGYRIGIEVFHQLHCLNLLRQSSFPDYYSHHHGDVDTDKEDLRGHVGKQGLDSDNLFSI